MAARPAELERFRLWMIGRNRTEGTAQLYKRNLALCFKHPLGPLGKLRDRDLAPKTRRHILASLRAWCKFSKDHDLRDQLDDIRLPAATRRTEKLPLDTEDWNTLQDAIEGLDWDPPLRAVLWMICTRGFRVSDVLRLSRRDVQSALDTGVLSYPAKGERWLSYTAEPFGWCLGAFSEEGGRWKQVADLISPNAAESSRMVAARLRVQRALRRLALDAGLDADAIHPHRLRRTYAVEFLREMQGDPEALVKLQDHMQWADLSTAASYVDHSRREELDAVAQRMQQRRRRQ